jgi:hypothetical protein
MNYELYGLLFMFLAVINGLATFQHYAAGNFIQAMLIGVFAGVLFALGLLYWRAA